VSRSKALRTADVHETRTAFSRGADDRAERLRACADRPIRSARTLREWHDLLLFVAAHPAEEGTLAVARDELSRMRERVRVLTGSSATLTNSGIDGTALEAGYSRPLVQWMHARWPGAVTLAAVDADAETVRDGLFSRLGVTVRIADTSSCALTTARVPPGPLFFHDTALRRPVDVPSIIAEPLSKPAALSPSARQSLLDTARTVLAALQRETDPITHASGVTLHDMGRGLRIALFSLDLAHRLPFDSDMGFMAFRNGVPLAYGGAWIFPRRSKIGINVFPSQRGYRVPLPRLRALVAEGLELRVGSNDAPTSEVASDAGAVDTAALTRLVQQHVVEVYHGDRLIAHERAVMRVHAALRGDRLDPLGSASLTAYRLWALPLDLVPDLPTWPAHERRRLDAIICAKGAPNERRHQRLLAKLSRLLDAWCAALER
jgi:hypothetical protein